MTLFKNYKIILFFLFFLLPSISHAGLIIKTPSSLGLSQGLVGWWTFDNNKISGNSALDSSGLGNTGTITDATKTIGKIGQALNFNGVSNVVAVADTGSSIDFTNTSVYTWSVWLYSNGGSGVRCYLAKDQAGGNKNSGFNLCLDANNYFNVYYWVGIGPGPTWTPGTGDTIVIPQNKWVNVSVVYNGSSNWGVYLNGIYKGAITLSVTSDSIASYYIGSGNQVYADPGQTPNPQFFFNGAIDDVRVYTRTLSTKEIQQLYNIGAASKANISPTKSLTSGLVGYWTFDGNKISGNSALDSSGLGNTGTITGATKTIGKIGQALSFNGTSDYVTIPNASNYLNFSAGAYSFWYKSSVTNFSGYPRIISYSSNGDYLECLYLISTAIQCRHASDWANDFSIDITVPNVTTDRVWHHVVYSWDINGGARTMALTFDGVETPDSSAITSASIVGNTDNNIHVADAGGGNNFSVLIDDVRLYNRGLSTSEAKLLYNIGAASKANISPTKSLTSGLVGYWTFDGNKISGNSALDSSGLGNTGTITGATKIIGKLGQALSFNGSSSYVGFTHGVNGGNLTLSFWVKTGVNTMGRVIGFGDYGHSGYYLDIGSTAPGKIDYSNASDWASSNSTVNDNLWHYVTVTQSGTTVNIYKDGIFDRQITGFASPNNFGDLNKAIGSNYDHLGGFFNGLIDDVRVYNRALSATEIKQLYNSGR